MRDVRNVHTQPEAAALQPIQRDRVVEVPRVLAVDRDRWLAPEIRAAAEIALADHGPEPPRLGHRFLAVRIRDAVLPDDDLVVHAGLVDPAQHLAHAPERPAGRRRPPRDLDDHHVRRRGVEMIAGRDLDVHDHPAVEWDDKPGPAGVDVVAADDGARAALENAQDAPLRALVAEALHARDDAVAVHGLVEVAPCDVDVPLDALDGTVGNDEAEAARMGRDAPDHQVHPVRKTEPVAPGLDQVAARDQIGEQALERGAVVARNLQPLQQLARRGWMVDLFADLRQQLLVVQHGNMLVHPPGRAGDRISFQQRRRTAGVRRGGQVDIRKEPVPRRRQACTAVTYFCVATRMASRASPALALAD